jgi:hypothetical protein
VPCEPRVAGGWTVAPPLSDSARGMRQGATEVNRRPRAGSLHG